VPCADGAGPVLPGVGANLADHAGVDIDCGYRGPARSAPLFHLLATFHSSATPSDEAPDLMLCLSDPRGDPPVFEIDAGLLRPRSRGTVRLRSAGGESVSHPGRVISGTPSALVDVDGGAVRVGGRVEEL